MDIIGVFVLTVCMIIESVRACVCVCVCVCANSSIILEPWGKCNETCYMYDLQSGGEKTAPLGSQ